MPVLVFVFIFFLLSGLIRWASVAPVGGWVGRHLRRSNHSAWLDALREANDNIRMLDESAAAAREWADTTYAANYLRDIADDRALWALRLRELERSEPRIFSDDIGPSVGGASHLGT